jgi:hypothetical protein
MRGEKDEVEERGAVGKPLTTKDTKEHKVDRVIGKTFTTEDTEKHRGKSGGPVIAVIG